MVVVDRFTKMLHFIPVVTLSQQNKLQNYLQSFLLPQLTSEHNLRQKNSIYKSSLEKLLEKSECGNSASTAYHPETDSQTEHLNGILNQYLCVYTLYMQDNWVELLPTAEFTYNNATHSATGISPFYANTGRNPRSIASDSMSRTDEPTTLAEHMDKIAEHMDKITDFLRVNLEKARSEMKLYADQYRRNGPTYKSGDKVMLSTDNISTCSPKAKWTNKRIGPFKIIKESHENSGAWVLYIQCFTLHC